MTELNIDELKEEVLGLIQEAEKAIQQYDPSFSVDRVELEFREEGPIASMQIPESAIDEGGKRKLKVNSLGYANLDKTRKKCLIFHEIVHFWFEKDREGLWRFALGLDRGAKEYVEAIHSFPLPQNNGIERGFEEVLTHMTTAKLLEIDYPRYDSIAGISLSPLLKVAEPSEGRVLGQEELRSVLMTFDRYLPDIRKAVKEIII